MPTHARHILSCEAYSNVSPEGAQEFSLGWSAQRATAGNTHGVRKVRLVKVECWFWAPIPRPLSPMGQGGKQTGTMSKNAVLGLCVRRGIDVASSFFQVSADPTGRQKPGWGKTDIYIPPGS